MQPSPYTPGEIAHSVPGRAPQLSDFDERLSYLVDLHRLVGRIRVDHAPRGLGKTSLLRRYEAQAKDRGVLTIWVTAGESDGLISQIVASIQSEVTSWRKETRTKLNALIETVTISFGIPGIVRVDTKLHQSPAATAVGARGFENLLRAVAESDETSGLMLFIDEIQAADPEGIRTLAYAWQHLQAEGATVPAAVFTAGLPNAPEKISSVVTFAERFAFRPLGILTPDAEEIAIGAPARALGVTWDPAALKEALEIARGYPYLVQLIADASWTAAGRPESGATVTLDHVRQGQKIMRADMDALFRARWANATSQERDLMSAMAELGDGPVERQDIAERMQTTSVSLSVPRGRLVDKGFIQANGRGRLEFTIPGFAAFIRELDE